MSSPRGSKKVLGVGTATLDIVASVATYPAPDAEVRASGLRTVRGGNVANTLVVLSRLGHGAEFAGVLSADLQGQPLIDDLAANAVGIGACQVLPGPPPTSSVLLAEDTGSRTIVHYRQLPELDAGHFQMQLLDGFDWIHFEGRNIDALGDMVTLARQRCPDTRLSLEVEKPRAGLDALFDQVDVILFSRVYAQAAGFDRLRDFLNAQHLIAPQQTLICAWGTEGAAGVDSMGHWTQAPACPPAQVVDTLGAGDVFNAGIIHGLMLGDPLGEVLAAACALAGRHCGHQGFDWTAAL